MDKSIDSYIKQIVKDLQCDKGEKQEIVDELLDHLTLLKQEFIEQGLTDKEATQKAIEGFGDTNKIHNGYRESLSPFYMIFQTGTKILFYIFSFVVIWKLILQRVISRLYEHFVNGINFNSYFFSLPNSSGYFDWAVWKNNMNIIPFRTTLNYIINSEHYNLNIIINNTFGNILIFIPIGIFLPILFKRYSTFTKTVTFSFIVSFLIEAIQLILQIGQFDIDDVILNVIGSILGYIAIKLIIKIPGFSRKTGMKLD